jgi:hypothetical protein
LTIFLTINSNDGGWNCRWDSGDNPNISSVHTTICVLEGLYEFVKNKYTYRLEDVKQSIEKGVECLLSRHLILNKKTNQELHHSMTTYHYPPRWKYDYLRVLELLASMDYPYDVRMDDALDLLKKDMTQGRLKRGQRIPGLIHFKLEETQYGRFNTLRGLKVLKCYEPNLYQSYINCEI